MLDKNVISEIVKACKEYVGLQVASLVARIDSIDDSVKNLPAAKDGAQGRDGIDGKDGAPGLDGQKGADGIDGQPGREGVDGKDGAPGERGADGAPGAKGEPGERGADGANGTPGADGRDGLDGKDGVDGKDGRPGSDGVDGQKGIDGAPGRDGEDGRDALDLDVLSAIDESKRYRRGTFASHKGGLWRATKTTDGMDGWECVVKGICSMMLVQGENAKAYILQVEMSDGEQIGKSFFMPAMIYRGVFREGDAYTPGDTATWGGSLWHCNESTTEKPLDGSKVWQLAAKRGRDGKDGRNGIDMTKGVKL